LHRGYNWRVMKALEVIPAIDLRGGCAVRLLQGDYTQETRYHNDPVALAQHWAQRGAPRLHLVDLDGARAGYPVQLELIQRIIRAVDIPVQVGGGVRSEDAVRTLLAAGADRVIVGTLAVDQPDAAEALFRKYGARLALALDVKSGRAATAGWQSVSETPYLQLAQEMVQRGAQRIIFTQVERDGTLQGVAFEPLHELLRAVAVPVIASGGVRDASDLCTLHALARSTPLEGVIVGKALYEGTLSDDCWKVFG
jgi:phosphoribosylformimino-5-aminoimidazole carboxamide ribotide isomerase